MVALANGREMLPIKISCVLGILVMSCAQFSLAQQPEAQQPDPHAGHNMADQRSESMDKDMTDAHSEHSDHNMILDSEGLVMNHNAQILPQDCPEITGKYEFEVYAGTEYAADYPGTVYGMSQHEYQVEPCSSITITFINNDDVRHQWMIHGLPRYLYPGGMFHLEATGGTSRTGTFIVPSDDQTYLVHCDMAQHMEMGMKAQLKAGKGSGDLWSIPGVSRGFRADHYLPRMTSLYLLFASLFGVAITVFVMFIRHQNNQHKASK